MTSLRSINAFRTEETAPGQDHYLSEECTICFESFTNKAFVNDCLHHFCFECIISWAKIKPVCPLCIQPITGIINNIRSMDDYDIQSVLPPITEVFDDAGSDWNVDAGSEWNVDGETEWEIDGGSDWGFAPDYTDSESSFDGDESMSVISESESSYVQQDGLSDSETCEPFSEAVGEAYENPQSNSLYSFTDDDEHSEVSLHSSSDNEESSYEEDDDKDDNSENGNEEYYEENDDEEDEYDNNNNDEDYEADDDDYNEDNYYDFDYQPESDYVDDEWDFASSNLSNNVLPVNFDDNLLSLSNILSPAHPYEETNSVWNDCCEEESLKNCNNEEEEYEESGVKYYYIDNSESDQDYLSNDDTTEFIYSSSYY